MRILVTGKNGQLGRSIHKLVNTDTKIDNNQNSNEFIFVGREELDLSSESSIANYFNNNDKFDIIINCAAYTAVDKAEEEMELANQVNHLAVKQLAQISKKQQAKLIHISTDYVFDGESDKPYIETDTANPINVYGKTKLSGEDVLQDIMPTDAIIIRTSWVYSEYGNNFVKTMLKLGKERNELNVVSDQIGSPTYATDLAEAILGIINNKDYQDKNQSTQIYHYSNEGEISWYDFAKEIFKLAEVDCKVSPITTEQYPTPAKRPKNTLMSKDKITVAFNVTYPDWKESLKNMKNMKNMKNNKICLIGLGYVGLPLAAAFAEKFQVIGFDINNDRIQELKNGHDKTLEIDDDLLQSIKSNVIYTNEIQDTKDCNIYIVTVPTPIDTTNRPDLTPLIESSKAVGTVLNQGDIVIYESTVYPGVTEDICVPELEKSSDMKFNVDFFCGYSPERINPGDKEHTVTKILKVTSGSTPEIAKQVDELYKEVITAGTYLASCIKVAEASKVIENTQRDVNIALINELALIFDQMGINTNEVIEAAATKWNFIKLTPGLVGGHCIGIDPYYLTFKAEEVGYRPDLILAARQINNGMSKYIADQTIKEMIKSGKTIKNSEILILGVTFKENCPDMRNTKVIDIIEELKEFGANIDVYDPWVDHDSEKDWYKHGVIENPLESDKKYDAVVVAVAHDQFKSLNERDFNILLTDNTGIIMDIKGIVSNATWTL